MRRPKSLWILPLLALAACDKATPVAPSGATISVTANPSQIALRGQSQVTAVVREANGSPVNRGTIVRFATTIGSIEESAETDAQGVARVTLRGDGRLGTAKVTASSGPITTEPIDVQIGQVAASVSLQATPTTISEGGGTISLLALVRDANGQPLADAQVNFRSEVGTLQSGGNFRTTNSDGAASDTLRVSAGDIGTLAGDEFKVTVEVGGAQGALVSKETNIGIQRPPQASFSFTRSGLVVVFTDTSTGRPTSWTWDFGDDTPISTQQNPTHEYSEEGTYVVTLKVRNSQGESTVSALVTVTDVA
jgi:PKD domain-containing protein